MSGIVHLPQLEIQPQQQPDPVARYGQLASIQGLAAQRQQQQALMPGQLQEQKQQLEAGLLNNQQKQLEVAQAQQDQKDQINFRQAFQDANGDPDKTVQLAAKSGVGPKLLVPFQASILKRKQDLLSYSEGQQKFIQSQADLTQGAWDKVNSAPESDKPEIYAQQLQGLKQLGLDTSQYPQQYDPSSFKLMGAVVNGHKQLLDDTFKAAEAHKNQAQGDEAEIKTQGEKQALALGGPLPGVPLENQEASAWLRKNPGKDLSDYAVHKASLNPIAQIQAANSAGGGLTDTAKDQAAERYWQTGVLPPTARGVAGLGQSRAIMNRAAELHPEGSIAANSAEFAANKSSLTKLQGNFDQVTAFENTAGKNLDVFLKTAKPIVDADSPWINKPLRTIAAGALGSADQAAFNAARQTAVTEIAKVLNSSNASGVLSDSARHEVEGLIGPTATLKQIYSAANVLKQDMANRHQSYQDQIKDIQGRLSNRPVNQSSPAQPETPAGSGKAVSLAAAKQLPAMKGKTDDEIKALIAAQGHTVAP